MNAMEIAGIAPATIAKFTIKNVEARDKVGTEAAAEGKTLSLWINITPDMARRWLKANFRNRPVSDHTVAAYARDMVNNVWRPTHQGIAFNDRDELIDGQHRLLAVIKARKTVRMMVTFGLASKIEGSEMTMMDCVDRGRTRTVADQLKIQHGLKNGTYIAQVSTALAHLCFGERVSRLSVGQVLDIYREYKAGADLVIAQRSYESGLKSAGVLAAFAFVIQAQPTGAAHRLQRVLNTGEGIEQWPALKKLRDFLTGETAKMILATMNRGIAELVVCVLKQSLYQREDDRLEMRPEEWLKSVQHFRELQKSRVDKVARLFELPKVDPVAAPNAATPRTPDQPREKLNACECGGKYPGKKHPDGCPKCRASYEMLRTKREGVKYLPQSEHAFGEAVL